MKKSLFIIAATALVVGCASNDVKNDIVQEEIAIGFSPSFMDKSTKANAGEMSLSPNTFNVNGNTLEVWGWKTNASSAVTKVFDNTTVTYNSGNTTTSTKWGYSPLRYWDRASTYKFYAAAPAGAFTLDESDNAPADRKFSKTGITDVQILSDMNGADMITAPNENAKDYLIAAVVDCNDAAHQGNNTTDHDVEFTFSHILSKLNVNVKTSSTFDHTGDAYPQIRLTSLSISIKGVCSDFSQKTAGELTAATTNGDEWSNPSSTATEKTCFAIGATGNTTALTLSTTANNVASYFVTPTRTGNTNSNPEVTEGVAEVKITIGYDIYYDGGSNPTSKESCLIEDLSVDNLQKIQQNTINNLNITVDPKAILFDVESITNWSSTSEKEVIVPSND